MLVLIFITVSKIYNKCLTSMLTELDLFILFNIGAYQHIVQFRTKIIKLLVVSKLLFFFPFFQFYKKKV